jgi:hypothetical protein
MPEGFTIPSFPSWLTVEVFSRLIIDLDEPFWAKLPDTLFQAVLQVQV